MRYLMDALKRHGAIAISYVLLTIAYTYPIVLRLREAIGGQQDVLEHYWNMWWVGRAVREGLNPFVMAYAHYPFGLPLYYHPLNLIHGLLSLPLQWCCGMAVAFNGLYWFAIVAAALGMYALTWYLTHQRLAAFVAGLIYGFSPYVAFHIHMGQPNLVAIQWLPWYTLVLLLALRRHWVWVIPAAIVLTINALTDWHMAVFAVLMTVIVALHEAFRVRQLRAILGAWGRLMAVGALFLALMLPVLLPMIQEERGGNAQAGRPLSHPIWHATDLLSFVLPSPFHPLWGDWASDIFFNHIVMPGIIGGIASVGWITLALSLTALWRDPRRATLFGVIALVAAILALGPYLKVNGFYTADSERPVPLPYLWFYQLPFMNVLRVPSRFIALVMLGLAALAGIGVAALWQAAPMRRRSSRAQLLMAGALIAAVLFEFWPRPFRMTEVGPRMTPAFYHELARDPGDYAIVEVPYQSPRSNVMQMTHGKATLGGRIARDVPHPWHDARVFGPLIRAVPPEPEIAADDTPEAWRAVLACQNVRYAIFSRQPFRFGDVPGLEAAMFGDLFPRYEDDQIRAYGPFTTLPAEPYWRLQPFEWYPVEQNEQGFVYRWLRDDAATLEVYPCGQTEVVLRFDALAFAQPRTLTIALDDQPVATVTLPADMLTPVAVPLMLNGTPQRITLHTPEAPIAPGALGIADDDRPLRIVVGNVSLAASHASRLPSGGAP